MAQIEKIQSTSKPDCMICCQTCCTILYDNNATVTLIPVEIQQEDPSENYTPTLGWSLRLFLGGSLFLDDEKILFIDDVY
jgi:hypothetical protein